MLTTLPLQAAYRLGRKIPSLFLPVDAYNVLVVGEFGASIIGRQKI